MPIKTNSPLSENLMQLILLTLTLVNSASAHLKKSDKNASTFNASLINNSSNALFKNHSATPHTTMNSYPTEQTVSGILLGIVLIVIMRACYHSIQVTHDTPLDGLCHDLKRIINCCNSTQDSKHSDDKALPNQKTEENLEEFIQRHNKEFANKGLNNNKYFY
jgi:hypothetical protein